MPELDGKKAKLEAIVAQFDSVAVAYSGGVDSTFLLAVCLDVLGRDRVLAVTSESPMIARSELEHACAQAAALKARHLVLPHDQLADPDVVANRPDRCYHCKLSICRALLEAAQHRGIAHVLLGENADDDQDYRPGSRAAAEMSLRAPLREAGLAKAEIRLLSRERGLPAWDRPASPCLATRFPYGTPLSAEGLARVEAAEAALLAAWGPIQLRVRDHFPVARLEVPPEQIAQLARPETRALAVEHLRALGYRYVTLDLTGYRMGSQNESLWPHGHSHLATTPAVRDRRGLS